MPDDVVFDSAIEQALHELAMAEDAGVFAHHYEALSAYGELEDIARAIQATVDFVIERYGGVNMAAMLQVILHGLVVGAQAEKVRARREAS